MIFPHQPIEYLPIQDKAAALPVLLYVEDNPANMTLVEQIISRRNDLTLLTAKNGNLGIHMARDYRPDAIIMDINLPDISGTAALGILRADQITAHIPVMALSSDAYPSQVARGLQDGFFRYLTKPFQINDFSAALDAMLLYAAANRPPRQDAGNPAKQPYQPNL